MSNRQPRIEVPDDHIRVTEGRTVAGDLYYSGFAKKFISVGNRNKHDNNLDVPVSGFAMVIRPLRKMEECDA